MFQDVGLKVLCVSWEGLDDKVQSPVWAVGKQSFFQAIVGQTFTGTSTVPPPPHLTFATEYSIVKGSRELDKSLI